jgi:D-alanyl-D-alanine carboxypeptidase
MRALHIVVAVAVFAAAGCGGGGAAAGSGPPQSASSHPSPVTTPPAVTTTAPVVAPETAAALQAAIDDWIAGSTSAGVAAVVRFPGGARWQGAAGHADEVHRIPMEPDDRFRTASITKMVTAATVLSLVEDGELTLDDGVAGVLPGFGLDPALTVRHLLGHRSGLWNYTVEPGLALGTWSPSPAEVVEAAVEAGPMFPPGSRFAYSNTNYVALGLVVEAVTGRPAHQVIRDLVIDPLAMRRTHLEGPEIGEVEAAPGGDPGAVAPVAAWTDGALVSTAGDLTGFVAALFFGDLLEPATIGEMTTEVARGAGYGLGVELLEFAGHRAVGHRGGMEGYLGGAFCLPDEDVCLAVLSNDWRGGNLWGLVGTLVEIAAG